MTGRVVVVVVGGAVVVVGPGTVVVVVVVVAAEVELLVDGATVASGPAKVNGDPVPDPHAPTTNSRLATQGVRLMAASLRDRSASSVGPLGTLGRVFSGSAAFRGDLVVPPSSDGCPEAQEYGSGRSGAGWSDRMPPGRVPDADTCRAAAVGGASSRRVPASPAKSGPGGVLERRDTPLPLPSGRRSHLVVGCGPGLAAVFPVAPAAGWGKHACR